MNEVLCVLWFPKNGNFMQGVLCESTFERKLGSSKSINIHSVPTLFETLVQHLIGPLFASKTIPSRSSSGRITEDFQPLELTINGWDGYIDSCCFCHILTLPNACCSKACDATN